MKTETIACPEGTVPGWLGTDGQPTSCVDNHPYPPTKEETVVSVPVTHMDALPHTAAPFNEFSFAIALLLVVVGVAIVTRSKKAKQ